MHPLSGSYPWKRKHWRFLVRRGKDNAHQCSRVAGSKVCGPNLPKRKASASSHHSQDRQLNHCCIHKQNGRNMFYPTEQYHKKSLVVVSGKTISTLSRAHSWGRKHRRRLALKKHSRPKRLVTQQRNISTN